MSGVSERRPEIRARDDREGVRRPDFLIVGAMKCGTSSLHHALDSHPDVYMPEREIFYFDIDDIHQHPDFFVDLGGEWAVQDWDGDADSYRQWYGSFFASAERDQVVGEDSTTYISSVKAPARIAEEMPGARILIMLRDPAARTYSHYWHILRKGRALFDFEDTLQFTPGNLIQRSCYLPQVQRYLDHFSAEQIKFVIFEDFISRLPEVVREVCRFIGVEPERLDPESTNTHRNRSRIPRSPRLQVLRNRLLRRSAQRTYLRHLPNFASEEIPNVGPLARWIDRIHGLVNPCRPGSPPAMRRSTRRFLNDLLARENKGLDDLVGVDLSEYWYRDPGDTR